MEKDSLPLYPKSMIFPTEICDTAFPPTVGSKHKSLYSDMNCSSQEPDSGASTTNVKGNQHLIRSVLAIRDSVSFGSRSHFQDLQAPTSIKGVTVRSIVESCTWQSELAAPIALPAAYLHHDEISFLPSDEGEFSETDSHHSTLMVTPSAVSEDETQYHDENYSCASTNKVNFKQHSVKEALTDRHSTLPISDRCFQGFQTPTHIKDGTASDILQNTQFQDKQFAVPVAVSTANLQADEIPDFSSLKIFNDFSKTHEHGKTRSGLPRFRSKKRAVTSRGRIQTGTDLTSTRIDGGFKDLQSPINTENHRSSVNLPYPQLLHKRFAVPLSESTVNVDASKMPVLAKRKIKKEFSKADARSSTPAVVSSALSEMHDQDTSLPIAPSKVSKERFSYRNENCPGAEMDSITNTIRVKGTHNSIAEMLPTMYLASTRF